MLTVKKSEEIEIKYKSSQVWQRFRNNYTEYLKLFDSYAKSSHEENRQHVSIDG